MPSLKDLDCSIELAADQKTLQEFGTTYADGLVETFVPVPCGESSFSIHLTSSKFIAPGIAMYVFIDGVYQCNRNRQDLKIRKASDSRSLVDFRVRQKEEKQSDGSIMAREWTFEELQPVAAEDAPTSCAPSILDNIGCIEVVVLRCAGPRHAGTTTQMNLDGANDQFDHNLGLDGQPRDHNVRSVYDDRGPFLSGRNTGDGPPPPVSYRAPYAETYHSYEDANARSPHSAHNTRAPHLSNPAPSYSRPVSRYSEPTSRHGRPSGSIPSSGFQYGSGPIPPESQTLRYPQPGAMATHDQGVDPAWLDTLLQKAVKQGVEAARRPDPSSETLAMHQAPNINLDTTQLPGAWPQSPHGTKSHPHQQPEQAAHWAQDHNSYSGNWGLASGSAGWKGAPARSKAETHVAWNPEAVWETDSYANEWTSPEEIPTDSWDTDESWTTKINNRKNFDSRGRSRASTFPAHVESRAPSPVTDSTHHRRRSIKICSPRARSRSKSGRSRQPRKFGSSSEENEGWTHIDAKSDSVGLWDTSDDTVQSFQSLSQLHIPRNGSRSEKQSRHSGSKHRHSERKSSRHMHHGPTWQPSPTILHNGPAHSVSSRVVPTVMNAPASIYPSIQPKEAKLYMQPAVSTGPPLGWGSTVPQKGRKTSHVTSLPPAPYAATTKDFARSTKDVWGEDRSNSSSPWGNKKDPHRAGSLWGPTTETKVDWGNDGDAGWGQANIVIKSPRRWEATPKDQDGVWMREDETKNNKAGLWEPSGDGWSADDTAKKRKDLSGAADAWGTNSKVVEAGVNDPWDNQGGGWYDHTEKDNTKDDPWAIHKFWTTAPGEKKSSKPASTSKRHTNKSLSKYRQLRSPASDVAPKSHWQFPPLPSNQKLHPISENNGIFIAPKEPLLKISKQAASEKGIEHQVRAGKGMQYGHAIGRPEYLDSLDKPYAAFRFKYRSIPILKSMFGDQIPDNAALTLPTPHSTLAKAKEKLKVLPQDELVEKMLRLTRMMEEKEHGRRDGKHKHKHKERRPSASKTEVAAQALTENWVKQQRREASEKGKSKVGGVSKAMQDAKDAKDIWDQAGNGDASWGNVKW